MSMQNVSRFRQIMMVYPIAVVADGLRVAIFAYSGRKHDGSLRQDTVFEMKNHALMCEASSLFWGDDDVFDFVMDHQGLEIGLTGTRVKPIQLGPPVIPKQGEAPMWEQSVNPETGEVSRGAATMVQPPQEPTRAHEAKIEIKSKYLKLII